MFNEMRDELVESDTPIAFAPSSPIVFPNEMGLNYNHECHRKL